MLGKAGHCRFRLTGPSEVRQTVGQIWRELEPASGAVAGTMKG